MDLLLDRGECLAHGCHLGRVNMLVPLIGDLAPHRMTCMELMPHPANQASRKLHERMAFAIFRSPMEFFETTPAGRILNRFSRYVILVRPRETASPGKTLL